MSFIPRFVYSSIPCLLFFPIIGGVICLFPFESRSGVFVFYCYNSIINPTMNSVSSSPDESTPENPHNNSDLLSDLRNFRESMQENLDASKDILQQLLVRIQETSRPEVPSSTNADESLPKDGSLRNLFTPSRRPIPKPQSAVDESSPVRIMSLAERRRYQAASKPTSSLSSVNATPQSIFISLDDEYARGKRFKYKPRSIKDVCKVLRKYHQMLLTSRSAVFLRSLLSEETSLELAKLGPRYLDLAYDQCVIDGVLCLPDEDVEYLLKISVKPLNKQDFTMKLTTALEFPEFPEDYEFSFYTYAAFYTALLEYNRRFFEIVKVLTDVVAPESLSKLEPPMNNNKEPKGYPRIYVEKIPFGQGPILLGQALDGQSWTGFPDIFSFVEVLMRRATETYEQIQENMVICNYQHIPVQPAESASATGPAPSSVGNLSAATFPGDYDPRPCFQMMRSGVCDKSDCPFQHDEKSLMTGILRTLEEITQYPLFEDLGVNVVFPHGYHVQGSSSDLTKSPPSDQRRVPTPPHATRARFSPYAPEDTTSHAGEAP